MVGPPSVSHVDSSLPVDVRSRFAERVTDPAPFSFLDLEVDWGLSGLVPLLLEGGVRVCGDFYLNSRYCGFKTLSGLRLLQSLSRGFR